MKNPKKAIQVLLAEDNPADVLLIREALGLRFSKVEISVHQDGEQMMHAIEKIESGEAERPDVVLLDLNLPRLTGSDALDRLRRSRRCGQVPVVVVTSSDSPRDRQAAERLGANCYFRKPTDYDQFMKLGDLVGTVLGTAV